MREIVYQRSSFSKDFVFESHGKKFNMISVEMFCKSTYDVPDILSKGSLVLETDNFKGDLWKLFALNKHRDYLFGKASYESVYLALQSGYTGFKYNNVDGTFRYNTPINCKCSDSFDFVLRENNITNGSYSVPQNQEIVLLVTLLYDDSLVYPSFEYVDNILQGESKNWQFDKNTNAFLLSSFLPSRGDYSPEFSDNMKFSVDKLTLPLSLIVPNTERVFQETYFDQNFLLGYPFANVKDLGVYNCHFTHEQDSNLLFGQAEKSFDLWIEK